MDETLLKLRILAKAETTLLKAHARRAAARGRLYALALGLLLLTVIMVNLAAYQYLSESMSEAAAALIIAAVNAALAVIMLVYASRIKAGPEEDMVQDIREMAMAELSADMEVVKDDFNQAVADLENIKTGVSKALGMFRGGGSSVGSLGPVLSLITSMLKK
jgi:hypothetical protein